MKPLQCENINIEGIANINILNVDTLNPRNIVIRSADVQNTSLVTKSKGYIKGLKNGIGLSLLANENTVEMKTNILNTGSGKKIFNVAKQRVKSIISDNIDIMEDDDHIYLKSREIEAKATEIPLEFRDSDTVRVEHENNKISFHANIDTISNYPGKGIQLLDKDKLKRLTFEGTLHVTDEKDKITITNYEKQIIAGKNCSLDYEANTLRINCIQPNLDYLYENLEKLQNKKDFEILSKSLKVSRQANRFFIEDNVKPDVDIQSSTLKVLKLSTNKFILDKLPQKILSKSLRISEVQGNITIENNLIHIGNGIKMIHNHDNSLSSRTIAGADGVNICDDDTLTISYNLRSHESEGASLVSSNHIKRIHSSNLCIKDHKQHIDISLNSDYVKKISELTKEVAELKKTIAVYAEKFQSVYNMIEDMTIQYKQDIQKFSNKNI
tara:strand:+ start:88 stop:1407 length:1320 start_codon:yes stop_codon:yes gene_type:complete